MSFGEEVKLIEFYIEMKEDFEIQRCKQSKEIGVDTKNVTLYNQFLNKNLILILAYGVLEGVNWRCYKIA